MSSSGSFFTLFRRKAIRLLSFVFTELPISWFVRCRFVGRCIRDTTSSTGFGNVKGMQLLFSDKGGNSATHDCTVVIRFDCNEAGAAE